MLFGQLELRKMVKFTLKPFMIQSASLMKEDIVMNNNQLMDEMMNNFKKSKVSEPVDSSDFQDGE